MLGKRRKMDLGTFGFPKTGFWATHILAIAGLYLLSRKTKDCDEY